MALRIDRLWGQPPGWFFGQPRDTQVQLLAEHRLLTETPEQRKTAVQRGKRAEFDRRMERHRG